MCYGKQQIVICCKTTENFGVTWSITFPERGSFATQVDKIYFNSLSFKCVLSVN